MIFVHFGIKKTICFRNSLSEKACPLPIFFFYSNMKREMQNWGEKLDLMITFFFQFPEKGEKPKKKLFCSCDTTREETKKKY